MTDRHPRAPWTDVTFAGVYWNCEDRLRELLTYVRPWFTNIVVGVQESPDGTLEVARELADTVVTDKHTGVGDTSIGKVLAAAKTRWVFLISDDERPDEALLNSFQDLVSEMRRQHVEGAWVHFVSTIDGFDFTREQDYHLRLFERHLKWPATQHSRPQTERTLHWRTGVVHHDRTLDEMVRDYIVRMDLQIEAGQQDSGMQAHNIRLTKAAISAIAERRGWDYIRAFEWWPRAHELVFTGSDVPLEAPVAAEPPTDEPARGRGKRRAAVPEVENREGA